MSHADLYYPNTCDKCDSRGLLQVVGDFVPVESWEPHTLPQTYFSGDGISNEYLSPTTKFITVGYPERCNPCNARSQVYKRARKSVERLDNIRGFADDFASTYGSKNQWKYLKFVTLTWENPLVDSPQPDMKQARKWLRRKRDKIADKLHVIAGTDVLECVTNQVGDKFHHHVHSHGIWVMPYHPIEHIGSVMKKYVGRDQCRAIKPLVIDGAHGQYTMSALAQARNYLIKYLSKEPGTRRSLWGMARGKPDIDTWYPPLEAIYEKIESV